jgi:hypothetical protein
MQASDVWTKLAAVGTLAASIIALAVATVPPLWRRYWRRPWLNVRIGAVEPWARVTNLSTDPQTWLRIEVVNKGRAEARNVRAVVHAWYERPDPSAQWVKRDLDPSALHWVSMPPEWLVGGGGAGSRFTQLRETAPVVSLPPGLSDFADLIAYTHHANEHKLILDNQIPRGFGFQPTNANGEFVLTITVVAENAVTVTGHIHYTLTGENLFSDVRFQNAPADYLSLGLLTGIERMRQQGDSKGSDATD